MEPCPHCGKSVDPQRCRYRPTLADMQNALVRMEWPSQRRARRFTVRCPHCSETYLSHTLRRFGFITHANYVKVVGLTCFLAVALVLFATHRG